MAETIRDVSIALEQVRRQVEQISAIIRGDEATRLRGLYDRVVAIEATVATLTRADEQDGRDKAEQERLIASLQAQVRDLMAYKSQAEDFRKQAVFGLKVLQIAVGLLTLTGGAQLIPLLVQLLKAFQ